SEIKSRCCELCGYIETAFGDAKGHNEKTVNAVDATCTKPGYSGDVLCETCGETICEGTVIDAKGHKDITVNAVDATCTEPGYSGDVLCETCGETISEGTVIDATGHKDITVNAVDATCTEPGYSGDVLCETCGETISEGTVIDATGHEYDEVSITKHPTCTESGEAKGKCIRCDDYNVTILEPLEHSYDEEVTAPTCTSKGYTIYTCSACGDCYLSNIVGMIPHSYESVVTEPTCTEKGFTSHICTACGDNYTDSYVEAKSHSYVKAVIEPTCTTNGYTTYTCTACGEGYSGDFVDKLGHKGGIAGCSELAVCDVCGESYGEFDNDNHTNIVIDESVDPTCSESGLTEGKHCEACGEVLTAQIVIEKLSHKYETVVAEPTCTEKGYTTYTCSDCGDYYMGDYKDSLEHEYNKNGVCDKCGEDRTENCSCNCHKSGISKFFFKLILFFQKIFKTNKVCKCGIKHY
ncbi:MAG: hypothetical protein II237_05160, partial [Clostridia bacterium]|nr:hypothetical protein [Clostridia bacterium]